MTCVDFDQHGVFELVDKELAAVAGGDVTVLVTAFGAIVAGPGTTPPQNGICPSASVPAPVNAQINAPCRQGFFGTSAPSGVNAACVSGQAGLNPVCISNYVC